MAQIHVISDTDVPPGRDCDCQWRPGQPCPNRVAYRVENLTNPGWSLMCEPHAEGFRTVYPEALVRYVRLIPEDR